MLLATNLEFIAFEVYFKFEKYRFYLHMEVLMQNSPLSKISTGPGILLYTLALGAKIIHVYQV